MSSPKEKPELDAMVVEMMPLLLKGKAPATSSDAEGFFTTKDFANAILDHTGEAVSVLDVYRWLKEKGYTEIELGSLQLHWPWKEVDMSGPFPAADNVPASDNEAD